MRTWDRDDPMNTSKLPVLHIVLDGLPFCQMIMGAKIDNWASSWDYGTYHIGDQRWLKRACASAQSRQSLRCVHTWSMEVDEGPTKNQTSSPTGWLCLRVWRMSLRGTKSTIISSHGLILNCALYLYAQKWWCQLRTILVNHTVLKHLKSVQVMIPF